MNSDKLFDVPDTPNRLAAKDPNKRSYVSLESDLSASGHSGYGNAAADQNGNRHNVNGVGRKRLFVRPPRSITGSVKSECHANSSTFGMGDSVPSRNDVSIKISSIPHTKEKYNLHLAKSENTDSKSRISSQQDCPVIDLTRQSGSKHAVVKAHTVGAQNSDQVGKCITRSQPIEHSHLHSRTSFIPSSSASKGTETDNLFKVGSSFKFHGEKDSASDAHRGPRKDGSVSLVNSPRVIRQKRLVRNGCISPHNIAKAKRPAGKEESGPTATGLPASSAGTSTDNAKDLTSKNGISSTVKGKGVVVHSSPSKEHEATKQFSRRLISIDDNAKETGDSSRDVVRRFDGSGGWRSTRNRDFDANLFLPNAQRNLERDDACFVTCSTDSRVMGRDDASSSQDSTSNGQDSASIRHVSGESAGSKGSLPGPQCRQNNGHCTTLNTVNKRPKLGPVSSSNGECSTSASDDLDTILLASPESRISTRSTRNPNHVGTAVEPVIVVDSPSSTTRHEGSRVVCSSSRSEDARARQLEADERLARELQEQLYNEVPSFGVGEMDEDIALALVQEDFLHASSGGDNQLSGLNGSLVTNSRRRQSRNASNISRRVSQARASTSNRMSRLRNRYPGQPRTLSSSGGRNSLFPPNMDVDMRMHILETLEAFSNIDVDGNLFQTQRDFNENDYERLLALDENNHQHGGASGRQINGLPQSTVQTENLEEACAICLETPNMGDVIRHLPCLHKFHKDCIDPWLRRRTSCPVCKSSIT